MLEAEGVFLHQKVSVLLSQDKTRNYLQFSLVLEAQKQFLESRMVEQEEVVVKWKTAQPFLDRKSVSRGWRGLSPTTLYIGVEMNSHYHYTSFVYEN